MSDKSKKLLDVEMLRSEVFPKVTALLIEGTRVTGADAAPWKMVETWKVPLERLEKVLVEFSEKVDPALEERNKIINFLQRDRWSNEQGVFSDEAARMIKRGDHLKPVPIRDDMPPAEKKPAKKT